MSRVAIFSRLGISIFTGAVVLFALACGGSGSSSSDVIFSVGEAGSADLFVIDTEAESPERLTNSPGLDVAPAWSPNKKLIAFISDRNGSPALWVMDSNGEEKRQVAGGSSSVTAFKWSPDSVRIALETESGGSRSIAILDTESGDSTPLTASTEDARIGDWSPDGEWVVYSVNEGSESAIRRRNPTGVDEITLFEGRALSPRWSRNGQFIAFSRINEDGTVDVVVMDKDGKDDATVASGVNSASPHDWSPDSKKLVYLSGSGDGAEIYVVGRGGDDSKKLTSNRVAERSPTWSSDGSSILFVSEGGGSADIFTMSSDGSDQKRLTTLSEGVVDVDW